MAKYINRARMNTATTGTGSITLGAAQAGFQSFADAGLLDGETVRYVIEDGVEWEIGVGVYTAAGTLLSRTVTESSNADALLNLTGSASVFASMAAQDISDHLHTKAQISDFPTLGTASTLNVPATGDAAVGDVVKGDDGRLTDARAPTAHTHTVSNITGLQGALDAKAPSVSPAFTGTPTAPTAAAGTGSTQIATTGYVDTAAGSIANQTYTKTAADARFLQSLEFETQVEAETGTGTGKPMNALRTAQAIAALAPRSAALLGVIQDEKASGTLGGSSSTGWQTRTLNTVALDGASSLTLSSNTFSSAVGGSITWRTSGAGNGADHGTRLVRVSDSAVIASASGSRTGTSDMAVIWGVAEIEPDVVYRIEYYSSFGSAAAGLGRASSTGQPEIYTQVIFWS